jgi:hypothetical protein
LASFSVIPVEAQKFIATRNTVVKNPIVFWSLVAAIALAAPAAMAQSTTPPKGPDNAGETSDRTPGHKTQAPLEQKDTYKGKTSDRSPDAKEAPAPSAGGVQPDHETTQGGKKSN